MALAGRPDGPDPAEDLRRPHLRCRSLAVCPPGENSVSRPNQRQNKKEGISCSKRELWNNLWHRVLFPFLNSQAQKSALLEVRAEVASDDFENRAISSTSAQDQRHSRGANISQTGLARLGTIALEGGK
jgi:hypothetical protein